MFPDMTDVLAGFTKPFRFAVISKTVVDYEVSEAKATLEWATGVRQPLTPQQLRIKPEGQRSWKWWTLWTSKRLKVDDVIQDESNRQYRIMEVSDWTEAGHLKFELMEQAV